MATILQPDEEKDQQQTQDPNQGVLNQTSGLTGISSSQGAQPTNNYQQQPKGSGRFTNVQKYLQANQGAGQQLAEKISKSGETEADKIRQGIQSAQTGFGQQEQQLQGNIQQGYQAGQQLFANPLQQNQEQVSQFQQVYNPYGIQQGVQGLNTDISGIQQGVANLQNLQQQAGTESGRFNLLRNAIGGPKYTQGQRRLDQLFLQATPAAKNIGNQFGQLASTYGQQADTLGQDLTARKAALGDLINQKSQELQNLYLTGTGEGVESDINQRGLEDIAASTQDRLAQANAETSTLDALRQRLEGNKLTSDDINKLGLTAGTRLYDVNLNDYITQANKVPTLASVANPEEFARYQALRQLAGRTDDIFSGATEAGGFKPYEFNKDALTQAIKQREGQFNDLMTRTRTNPLINISGRQAGQSYANTIAGRAGPNNPYLQFVHDLKAYEQMANPTYADVKKIAESYQRGINFLSPKSQSTVQAVMQHYGPAFNEFLKQAPGFQYDRMINPADNLESGGYFGVS